MSNIKLFESKQIRSIWSEDNQKWYFSIIDVANTEQLLRLIQSVPSP